MTIGLPETEEPLSSSSSSLRNAGVLVVDEDPAFQLGLKTFLREYVGFETVFSAGSGDEALELIQSEDSINVITLDYRMPGLTGIDVLEKLSENTPRALTVLMITGYPSDELEKRFRSYNSSKLITSQFLTKPVEFEKLEPIILQSYEDLKKSQRLTKTLTGEAHDETGPIQPTSETATMVGPEIQESLDSLDAKLVLATSKIEELQSRIPNIQERFWLGVLKLLSVAVLLWVALQMGWFEKAREYLNPAVTEEPVLGTSVPIPMEPLSEPIVPELRNGISTPPVVDENAPLEPLDEPAPEPPIDGAEPLPQTEDAAAPDDVDEETVADDDESDDGGGRPL